VVFHEVVGAYAYLPRVMEYTGDSLPKLQIALLEIYKSIIFIAHFVEAMCQSSPLCVWILEAISVNARWGISA
jgi:hypothetical protein